MQLEAFGLQLRRLNEMSEDTKCPNCDDNLLSAWKGVVIIYEDGEQDKYCDYLCFQQQMIKIWDEEIKSIMVLEVGKL